MTEEQPEPVVVTDKRRIDPETGEVRPSSSGPAPSGPAPESPGPDAGAEAAGAEAVGAEAVGADAVGADAEKLAELTADLQRVQADFVNYRKRAQRDQQAAAERAKAGVVTELLGVVDDLERARAHGDLESGPLKSVADKLAGVLNGLGLTAFGAEGEDFDPLLHEAVQHEGDGGHPVIGTVMRQGYKLGEQVLRHAMVGVVDTVPGGDAEPTADVAEGGTDPDAES